jgi:hypothetical protein
MVEHPHRGRQFLRFLRSHWLDGAAWAAIAWSHAAGSQAAPFNLAPDGDAILGAGSDAAGTDDVAIFQAGIINVVNDQDVAETGPFDIRVNRSVDTFTADPADEPRVFDFVGVLFDGPQNGVNSVRVQNFIANDGGWWGPPAMVAQNGAPLIASDLVSPEVQVTTNGGTTWTTVASTSNYVTAYTGVVRGVGVPTSSAGPLASFSFAPQAGINGIRLVGEGGGNAGTGAGFLGVIELEVLQDVGVVYPTLNINTSTGAMTLNTGTGTARGIQGYSISSAADVGALNPAAWLSIADNYDTGHPGPNQIDANDPWTELSSASTNVNLSEFQFDGDGGSLAASRSIPLGNAWIRNPFGEDIRMEITLPDGRKRRVEVTYNGAAENPVKLGDFNFDGSINATDWPVVRNNFNANLTGLTAAEAYALGDMNTDGVNDELDFAEFKTAFDAVNGVGAFQAMLAQAPEPGSQTLLALGAGAAFRRRRKSY